ncbi:MAG: hypothetical protein IKC24_04915 [Oscillospiraceae bacterium]|nr:hypothetical protein [Oscillospiraceae bacterium]
MKKMITLVLALVLVLAMTACGSKDFKRDSKGYLTEDAAESVAAQSVGYTAEDVAFGETKFEGDSAGGDETAYFDIVFSDGVAEYKCKVNAINGTVYDSSAK